MTDQTTTPDPAPATYPPDMRPSQILGMAIDAHRHTRIGGGDPGDPASFIARWLVEQDYALRSTIPGPNSPVEEITAAMRADALSGLLRGMARRAVSRRHLVPAMEAKLHLALNRADEAEAELARLRPVVDAARAWKAKRDGLGWPRPRRAPVPEESSVTEASDLYAAVAALDGDRPAPHDPDAEIPWNDDPMPDHLLHGLVRYAQQQGAEHVSWLAVQEVRRLRQQVGSLRLDRREAWTDAARVALDGLGAVSSAPPADATTRLAAAADALDAIGWAGLGSDLRDIAQQLTPGDPNSGGGVEAAAAAVARALATPTTDTEKRH